MPRRLNFTKRKRILREDVQIRLNQSDTGGLSFDADLRLAANVLAGLAVPAAVHVEAYRGATATWKRFYFGTTASITHPSDRSLVEFGVPHGVLFRVRLTSVATSTAGQLIAEADSIRPLMPGETKLPVQPLIQHIPASDLGHELWRVDFSGEMPLLKINDSVSMGVDQFLVDPKIRSLFAPAVMRQVLTRIMIIEQVGVDDEDGSGWQQKWLQFAANWAGNSPPAYSALEDLDSVEDWIDTAVVGFAKRAGIKRAFELGEIR